MPKLGMTQVLLDMIWWTGFSHVEKDPKVVSPLSGKAVTELPVLGPIRTIAAKDKDQ